MRHTTILLSAVFALSGCRTPDTASAVKGVLTPSAGTEVRLTCQGFGNYKTLLTIANDEVSLVQQGEFSTTGSKVADTRPGYTTFGAWTGNNHYAKDKYLFEVSAAALGGGEGPASLLSPEGFRWSTTCRPQTSEDQAADQCLEVISHLTLIDTEANPAVTKSGDTTYEIRFKDAATGDFVWTASVVRDGLLCRLAEGNAIVAKSCSAIVADATFDKAAKDGSSSGAPYVQKTSAGKYKSGIHDAESGEFKYKVKTSNDADGCAIEAMTGGH